MIIFLPWLSQTVLEHLPSEETCVGARDKIMNQAQALALRAESQGKEPYQTSYARYSSVITSQTSLSCVVND